MKQVAARAADRRFARLLRAAGAGEQVVISKYGRPVAVVSPYRAELSDERNAAVETLIRIMNEPLFASEVVRRFSRDEMHER